MKKYTKSILFGQKVHKKYQKVHKKYTFLVLFENQGAYCVQAHPFKYTADATAELKGP